MTCVCVVFEDWCKGTFWNKLLKYFKILGVSKATGEMTRIRIRSRIRIHIHIKTSRIQNTARKNVSSIGCEWKKLWNMTIGLQEGKGSGKPRKYVCLKGFFYGICWLWLESKAAIDRTGGGGEGGGGGGVTVQLLFGFHPFFNSRERGLMTKRKRTVKN